MFRHRPNQIERWLRSMLPRCVPHAFEHGHKTGFLGHEGAGEMIEVAQPGKVEIGDRIVIMPNTLVVDARSVLLVTIFTV